MELTVGDFVDYIKKSKENWHGLIVKIDNEDIWVLWLMSDVERQTSPSKKQKNAYYRGYTTIHPESELALCQRKEDGSWSGRRHPKTNPWGEIYGMVEH
jgi:hypothetical protein